MSVQTFYDELAPLFHLVYENWEASVARQGRALASLIGEHWGPRARTVLDAAVGIGTQALGLLALGFRVTGSDLSHTAVNRARREAGARHLPLRCVVADFRALPLRAASVDVVIVCDNSLPHLETPGDIETALGECFRCARPGGGCLVSMRDYGPPPPSGDEVFHAPPRLADLHAHLVHPTPGLMTATPVRCIDAAKPSTA
jgi:ubiquinone/menaquinone biosynthesis C-methylase UbiE